MSSIKSVHHGFIFTFYFFLSQSLSPLTGYKRRKKLKQWPFLLQTRRLCVVYFKASCSSSSNPSCIETGKRSTMRQDDVNLFFVRLERRTMRMNMETQANDDLKLKVCNCNTVSHPFGFLTPKFSN